MQLNIVVPLDFDWWLLLVLLDFVAIIILVADILQNFRRFLNDVKNNNMHIMLISVCINSV